LIKYYFYYNGVLKKSAYAFLGYACAHMLKKIVIYLRLYE